VQGYKILKWYWFTGKPTGLMEDSPTPTFLELTAIEWHTFGYCVKEGVRFWKRTPLAWGDAK
jgi:hypothetical protein